MVALGQLNAWQYIVSQDYSAQRLPIRYLRENWHPMAKGPNDPRIGGNAKELTLLEFDGFADDLNLLDQHVAIDCVEWREAMASWPSIA